MSEYWGFVLLIATLAAAVFFMQWMDSRNDDSIDW